jgi:hypothetical protein
VTLEETDRLLECAFCRVKLYITSKETFHYWMQPKRTDRELILIPYWRFKGMTFSCKAQKTEERIVDTTLIAADIKGMPVSLGVRPQAVPLRYVTLDVNRYFFVSYKPFKSVFSTMETKFQRIEKLKVKPSLSAGNTVFHRAFIGETMSVIYLPTYINNNFFYDAVTDKPIVPLNRETQLDFTKAKDWGLRFLATLCPYCGWDLKGEKDSLVLFCRNCNSAWEASLSGLKKIEFSVVPQEGGASIFLPFWKIKANVSSVQLNSYADLVRFANLPKVIKSEWENQEIAFWVPAFKIQPRHFLRASKSATLAQLKTQKELALPKGYIFTVNLPESEAIEAVKISIFDLAVPKKEILPIIDSIEVKPLSVEIVLVPFQETSHGYIQQTLHLSFGRGLLWYGRNI